MLSRFGVVVLPFPGEFWTQAHAAYARFGRGRHPAQLNFGDCLCYVIAKATGLPLLCTGQDFARTDLPIAGY